MSNRREGRCQGEGTGRWQMRAVSWSAEVLSLDDTRLPLFQQLLCCVVQPLLTVYLSYVNSLHHGR